MKKAKGMFKPFRKKAGQGLIEYASILAFVSMLAVASLPIVFGTPLPEGGDPESECAQLHGQGIWRKVICLTREFLIDV